MEPVHKALKLFSSWAAMSSAMKGNRSWILAPLSACLKEVIILVASRLYTLVEIAGSTISLEESQSLIVLGSEARTLFGTLHSTYICIEAAVHRSAVAPPRPPVSSVSVWFDVPPTTLISRM